MIQQLWSDHAVVRGLVAKDGLLLRFVREIVKAIDSFRVKDFIDAGKKTNVLV